MVMNRPLSIAAPILLALGTAACGPETNRLTPISNPSLYSVNQPVVQHTNFIFDVANAPGGLATYDQGRLAQWFESLELGYGDRVFVQDGGLSGARDDVARIAGNHGVLLSEGAPVTAGPVVAGGVRVIVARAEASVPGCPVWENETVGAPEQTSTNYGCATNQNLARMIADPNDLVRGQDGGSTSDSIVGTKAIKAWRDKQPSAGGANK
jgi:pilus assembly protein CpaD